MERGKRKNKILLKGKKEKYKKNKTPPQQPKAKEERVTRPYQTVSENRDGRWRRNKGFEADLQTEKRLKPGVGKGFPKGNRQVGRTLGKGKRGDQIGHLGVTV